MRLTAKVGISVFYFFLFLFYGLFLLTLIGVYFLPDQFWISGFLTFLLPVFFGFNLLLTIALLFFKSPVKWLGLIFLLSGFYIVPAFYNFSFDDGSLPGSGNELKVISYNISGYQHKKNKKINEDILAWVAGQNPDILCIQEYLPKDTKFGITKKKGPGVIRGTFSPGLESIYPFHYKEIEKNMIGVATFSKFPILNQGIIFQGINKHNKGIFTDILFHSDTLRVINVHLESNTISPSKIVKSKNYFVHTFKTLKNNHEIRSKQMDSLISFIEGSDKKIILAGDINDTQFSQAYLRLSKLLDNSFEEAGSGVGATFKPWKTYLRIDHQFHSKAIDIKDITVSSDIRFSDHVPVMGVYTIKKAASSFQE